MNLDLTEDQQLMRDSFAGFLGKHSSTERVRAAMPLGFDAALWKGFAELGAFGIRTPEDAGGLGLGTFEATLLMEEAGRTLASGPIAETLLAARLLAQLGDEAHAGLLTRVLEGEAIVTLAYHDLAKAPVQWLAGGAVAEAAIVRDGDQVLLITLPDGECGEPNLASTPIAQVDLAKAQRTVLATGAEARVAFEQAVEEWKLLMAAALLGLARQGIDLAAAYAGERKAFGQLIGTFQGVSHPLATLVTDLDAGKCYLWRTIWDVTQQRSTAGAQISLVLWWATDAAARAVSQSLHTFGGYGLTVMQDIHLFNLRAKAWPLVFGDPKRLLEQAGRRLYGGEATSLPDVGEVAIDYDLGAEAAALAKETDEFFRQNLTPELRAKAHYSYQGYDAELNRKKAAAGILFPSWPKEYGGREVSPYAAQAATEVWEDHDWGSPLPGVTNLIARVLMQFASDELKAEVLPRLAAGEANCSLGYSEPGSGSDIFAAQTRATPDGNGWRIDGQKMFTSGAHLADYVLLLTRTDPDAPKHKGITLFLVPLKAPGVTVQPIQTFQDESTNITYYDGVKIPDSYRVSEVNGGIKVLTAALEMEHIGGYAKVQERTLAAGEALCREIEFDGRPLIEDGMAQVRLAIVTAKVHMCRAINDRVLWATTEKKPAPAFGPMARLFSAETFLENARDLLDLTAPLSLSKPKEDAFLIDQSYRQAHGTRIYGGTQEVHRSMIAEKYLGLPRTRA